MQRSAPNDKAFYANSEFRQSSLVTKSINRLRQRSRLYSIARDVFAGIRDASNTSAFASEQDVNQGSDQCLTPGSTGVFACAKDKFSCDKNTGVFDCIGTAGFDCNATAGFNCQDGSNFGCATNWQYTADCAAAPSTSFDCNSGTAKYDCGQLEQFVCMMYDCSGGNDGVNYDCGSDKQFDFFCVDDFNCKGGDAAGEGFECTAEHIFQCWDDHDCKDVFTCKANGDCDAGEHQYTRKDDEGDTDIDDFDPNPGDFVCGNDGGDEDQFDCQGQFGCAAEDEFDCSNASTSFNCGDGGETDKFDCDGTPNKFSCGDKSFDCQPRTEFNCDPELNFQCIEEVTFNWPDKS